MAVIFAWDPEQERSLQQVLREGVLTWAKNPGQSYVGIFVEKDTMWHLWQVIVGESIYSRKSYTIEKLVLGMLMSSCRDQVSNHGTSKT